MIYGRGNCNMEPLKWLHLEDHHRFLEKWDAYVPASLKVNSSLVLGFWEQYMPREGSQ